MDKKVEIRRRGDLNTLEVFVSNIQYYNTTIKLIDPHTKHKRKDKACDEMVIPIETIQRLEVTVRDR